MILKDEVGIITITIKRKDKKSAGGGGQIYIFLPTKYSFYDTEPYYIMYYIKLKHTHTLILKLYIFLFFFINFKLMIYMIYNTYKKFSYL